MASKRLKLLPILLLLMVALAGPGHATEHDGSTEDGNEESGCSLYGPSIGDSPVVDGGTRLDYSLECSAEHSNHVTVQVLSATGTVLLSIAEQTEVQAAALHARQYDLPLDFGALGLPAEICLIYGTGDEPPATSCTDIDGSLL